MDATLRAFGGLLTVRVTADTVKGLIEQLSEAWEYFGEGKCGACESPNVRPQYRKTQGKYDYYELKCLDCRAVLTFGQTKEAHTLFPRRKDEHGYLENHGWVKFQPQEQTQQRGTARSSGRSDAEEFF